MAEGSILVVSTEVGTARALQITLAAKGYEVTKTASVKDAVRLNESGRHDLVLLDSDASSAVEACREIRAGSNVAIVIMSGDNSEEEKARAILAGANTYLAKPFGVAEVFAGIRANMAKVRGSVIEQPPDQKAPQTAPVLITA